MFHVYFLFRSINEVIFHVNSDLRPLENSNIINLYISFYKYGSANLNETFVV